MNNSNASETASMIDSHSMTSITKQKPNTHLKWSLLNLICSLFCLYGLFFSMFALNNSFKTQNDIESGNLRKARRHSKMAKKFNIIITALCLTGSILFILFVSLNSINSFQKQKITHSKIVKVNSTQILQRNVTTAIIGKWKLEYSDTKFEEYLIEIGVNFFLRKIALNLKPLLEFQLDDNKWTISGVTTFKTKKDSFKLNEDFYEETFEIWSTSVFRLQDNKLVKTQRNNQNEIYSIISFEVTSDDKLKTVSKANKIESIGIFERVVTSDYE